MIPLRRYRYAAVIVLAALCSGVCQADVTVAQDTITFKTWGEGLPDINPWFELFPSYNYAMYPYTFRNNFLSSTASVSWRELTVENEYLSCRVLPDLGGHLYSCLDKTSNKEMFYANPVIRKGSIALRGAWVALGIELNFPVGHSLVSVSPVSFGTQQNPDGSAGIWVADIDRQTGMEWRVEFVLRPRSTVLEQDVWLYNRGAVRQPYYFWTNAEETIQDLNDTFSYPAYVVATHGFTSLDTWTVNQAGLDMSVIKNYTGQTAWFTYGSNEPFFAAYHPATKIATVHYADPVAMPGKKLFAWGPDPQYGDAFVKNNLTENFPSYIETQAGVVPNQETHIFLDPQQTSHFTEYWMPSRGLDGITRANLSGVLYLGRTTANGQPALKAEFNANQAVSSATVKVSDCATPPFAASVDLDPAMTWVQTVPGVRNNVNCTFQLLDSNNNVLMTHTENQYDAVTAAQVKLGPQSQPDINKSDTEAQVLFRATFHEQSQLYYLAESDYILGLQRFPPSTALRKGAGRLAVLSARYDDAATLLAQVTARTPGDNEAHYYLGLAYAALGRNDAAANEWTAIQSTADFGVPATFELASLRALTGDLDGAAGLFDGLSSKNPALVRAAGLEIAILRHQGKSAGAASLLSQWRGSSPTDLFLRYEATLLNVPDSGLFSDLGADPERVLNLVDDYLRLGFYSDALALLSRTYPDVPGNQREPGSLTPQNNALIAYYRGYCRQKSGASPAADFVAASGMALPYIFPNRTSSFAVLRAAIQANDSDATAHYLLGLLYMGRRQSDNAITEWQKARTLNKNLPALARNLGRAYLDIKDDPATALPVLREGLTNESANSDLQDAYNRANAAAQAYTSCSFTLPTSSATVGAEAAAVNVSFTTVTSSCAWTAATFAGWITATSSGSGTGNGAVSYAVAANTGLTSRSAILMIAGHAFTITQAASSCSLSLTSSSVSAPAGGGTFYVGVISPSDACGWSASTAQNWISIVPGTAGNGGVSLTVAPNNGASRTGTVTIANQPFTITQSGNAGLLPIINAVITASGFGGSPTVSPGSWVEIYGSALASSTRAWGGADFIGNNAPTSLDGVQVTIGGQKAFVDYISSNPGQINAQLPSNIATVGTLPVTVTNASNISEAFNVAMSPASPGLLAPASFQVNGRQYLVALLPDATTYILPPGAIPGIASRQAHPAETIITYGIGFGPVTPDINAGQIVTQANQLSSPLQILFGQTPALVQYAGLSPGFVGLYQFNVVVPAVPDNDLVPLTFNLGGVAATQTLYTAVHQ